MSGGSVPERPPPPPPKNPAYYFEPQKDHCCGIHAINHILQKKKVIHDNTDQRLVIPNETSTQRDDPVDNNNQINAWRVCEVQRWVQQMKIDEAAPAGSNKLEEADKCKEDGDYTANVLVALVQNELRMKCTEKNLKPESAVPDMFEWIKTQGTPKGYLVHLGKDFHWHALRPIETRYVVLDSLETGPREFANEASLREYYTALTPAPTTLYSIYDTIPVSITDFQAKGLSPSQSTRAARWIFDTKPTNESDKRRMEIAISLAKEPTPRERAKDIPKEPEDPKKPKGAPIESTSKEIEDLVKANGDVDDWSSKLIEKTVKGPGVGKLVKVAGASFLIDTSSEADERRTAYFTSQEGTLDEDETKLLNHIGIDPVASELRQLLPEFFRTLPDCQTDASLYTKLQCETPYRVLWQSMWLKKKSSLDTKSLRLGSFAIGEIERIVKITPLMRMVAVLESLIMGKTVGAAAGAAAGAAGAAAAGAPTNPTTNAALKELQSLLT